MSASSITQNKALKKMARQIELSDGQMELTGDGFDQPIKELGLETPETQPDRETLSEKHRIIDELIDRFDRLKAASPSGGLSASMIRLSTRINTHENNVREFGNIPSYEAEKKSLFSFLRHSFENEGEIENLLDGLKLKLREEEKKISHLEEDYRKEEALYENGIRTAEKLAPIGAELKERKEKVSSLKNQIAFLEKYLTEVKLS